MSFIRNKRDAQDRKTEPKPKGKGTRQGFSQWKDSIPDYIPKTLVGNDKLYVVVTARGVESFVSADSIPEDAKLPIEDFLSVERVPGTLRQVYRENEKQVSAKKRTLYAMRIEGRTLGKKVEEAIVHPNYTNLMAQGRQFAVNIRSALKSWDAIVARDQPDERIQDMVILAFSEATAYVTQMGFNAGKDGGKNVLTLKEFEKDSPALSSLMSKVLNDTFDPSRTAMDQFDPKDKTKGLSVHVHEWEKIKPIMPLLSEEFLALNKWLISSEMLAYFAGLEKGETARERVQESYHSTRIILQWGTTAVDFMETKKLKVPNVGSCLGISAFIRGMNALLFQMKSIRIPMGANLKTIVPLFVKNLVYNENTTMGAKTQVMDSVKEGNKLSFDGLKPSLMGGYLKERMALGGLNAMYPYIDVFEVKLTEGEAKVAETPYTGPPPVVSRASTEGFLKAVLEGGRVDAKDFLKRYNAAQENGSLEEEFRHLVVQEKTGKEKKKDQKSLRQTTRRPLSAASVSFLTRVRKKKGEEERVLYPAREEIGNLLSSVSTEHFQMRMVDAFRALAQRSLIFHDGDLGAVLEVKSSSKEEEEEQKEEIESESEVEDLDD